MIVTLGAANKIHEKFPDADIRVFAVMRPITNPSEFHAIVAPCIGWVMLSNNGATFRRP